MDKIEEKTVCNLYGNKRVDLEPFFLTSENIDIPFIQANKKDERSVEWINLVELVKKESGEYFSLSFSNCFLSFSPR